MSERQYAAKKMPRLLDPRQCDLKGDEINDAVTRKLCNKGLIFLRDFLTDNDVGGLTALHTGEGELEPFETLINDALDTPGVEIPAGCAELVPSGIIAAVKELKESCKELNEPTDLKYAAELLLGVDVEQASTNEEISKMLADTGTVGLQSLPGGPFSYEVRRPLEGQPIVIAGDDQSFVIRDMCASSLACTCSCSRAHPCNMCSELPQVRGVCCLCVTLHCLYACRRFNLARLHLACISPGYARFHAAQ